MAFLWRLSVKHISITPILTHSLTVCFRKAGLKLPVSCCCNSSVHCSTGPQKNVDDDYCACRPRQCRVKVVGEGGLRGIHILGAPHIFLNRGPAWSKSGPDHRYNDILYFDTYLGSLTWGPCTAPAGGPPVAGRSVDDMHSTVHA